LKKVRVNLMKRVDDSYDILIGRGLLEEIPARLKKRPVGNKYAIITDSNIRSSYGKKFLALMKRSGLRCCLLSFPAGEKHKTLATVESLQNQMLENGIDRKSAVIALGGGVVGDAAGFAAGTYMRGIPFIQVPTSLLAMVDSSIGGKVGVNLAKGKNSCGLFSQPKMVFSDVSLLKSLPKRELRNGLAEAIKHAVIADKNHFYFIEQNKEKIIGADATTLTELIKRSCEIKAGIVEIDEREQNFRKIVNYGHTVGHAIEVLTKFREFSHGEAIAIGMAAEGRLAVDSRFLTERELYRQNKLLEDFGFNIGLPKIRPEVLVKEMRKDKKAVSGKIQFALPSGIGRMKSVAGNFGLKLNEKDVLKVLRAL